MDEELKKKNNELSDDEVNSVAGGGSGMTYIRCPYCSGQIAFNRSTGRGACRCGYVISR